MHIKDLTSGTVFEGIDGDRWIVQDVMQTPDRINVELIKLKVVEEIIRETL